MKTIFKLFFSLMLCKHFKSKTDVTDAKSIFVHLFLSATWKVMWFLLNENEYWSKSRKAISYGFKSDYTRVIWKSTDIKQCLCKEIS